MSLNVEKKRASAVRKAASDEARNAAKRAAGIPWKKVEAFALAGAPELEIIEGLGITDAQLRNPETAAKLRALVVRANGWKKLELRSAISKRGKRSGGGSVNSLSLEARNILQWDQQKEPQEAPPDIQGAKARLLLTLARIAAARSEELGREVSEAEILLQDVCTEAEIRDLLPLKKEVKH